MSGDGIDTEFAIAALALSALLCVWAALVLWAQVRMRQERRLRRHAEEVARSRGIDRHMYGILVDRRRARTTIVWFEGEEYRSCTQQWRNRFDGHTSVAQWYNGGTDRVAEERR
ncbi:MAG TPA: hypothetical protein VK065_06605 [Brevibacterium sp.]|nr:hypothetical protein [Brevibacterium sp.]